MSAIAIIPARGGSKRLLRKNVLPLGGKPLLHYPVQCALESSLFREVIVSTEDAEIAEIAESAGARVLPRPESLATDVSKVQDVCAHVLGDMRDQGNLPDVFCCIYATAVFITPEDLQASKRLLDADPQADMIMGVSRFNYHPAKALVESDGYLRSMWPEFDGVKPQHCPILVCSNGTLYWGRSRSFLGRPSFYPEHLVGYEMESRRAVDIDTAEDFELARLLFYQNSRSGEEGGGR